MHDDDHARGSRSRSSLPAAAGFGPLAEEPVADPRAQMLDPRQGAVRLPRTDLPPAGVDPAVAPGARGVEARELPLDVPEDLRQAGARWAVPDGQAQSNPGPDPRAPLHPLSHEPER
jgi:hypothetical protein